MNSIEEGQPIAFFFMILIGLIIVSVGMLCINHDRFFNENAIACHKDGSVK